MMSLLLHYIDHQLTIPMQHLWSRKHSVIEWIFLLFDRVSPPASVLEVLEGKLAVCRHLPPHPLQQVVQTFTPVGGAPPLAQWLQWPWLGMSCSKKTDRTCRFNNATSQTATIDNVQLTLVFLLRTLNKPHRNKYSYQKREGTWFVDFLGA